MLGQSLVNGERTWGKDFTTCALALDGVPVKRIIFFFLHLLPVSFLRSQMVKIDKYWTSQDLYQLGAYLFVWVDGN